MALTLLAITLIGFAPTFTLRSRFDGPVLPLRTHLHGALFTSWFVLLLIQSALVERRRLRWHRRVGVLGAVLATSMVLSALVILYHGVFEFYQAGGSVRRASGLLWGNLAILAAFSSFVAAAIMYRNRPELHKRLVLLASLSVIPQPLGRIGTFAPLQIGQSPEGSEAIYALGGLALLLSIMLVRDVAARGRPHPALLWGSPLLLGSIIIAGLVIPATPFGQALVRLIY